MNRELANLVADISKDKFEIEFRLCDELKKQILNLIKDYAQIDEKSCFVSIQKMKNLSSKFNFSCQILDVLKK